MIDNNLFKQNKLENFVTLHQEDRNLNATLKFYYLTEEKESTGYELYKEGGYLGFTPASWNSDMGIFHMFKHLK